MVAALSLVRSTAMSKLLTAALAMTLVVVSGCSSLSKDEKTAQPGWILQPPADTGKMMYGVGSATVYGDAEADAMKQATQSARMDLLSKLKVEVSGSISSNIEESRLNGESSLQQSFARNIRSELKPVEFAGLNIQERYLDGKTLYALASLDVTVASQALRRDISRIDDKLDRIQANQNPNGSTLQQIGQLMPVASLIRERQQMVSQLALLKPVGSVEISESHLAMNDRLNNLLDSLICSVNPITEHAVGLTPFLIQALNEQGIKVGGDHRPDLSFDISSTGSDQQQNGRFYHLVNATVQLRGADDRVIDSFSSNAKGVSGVQDMAWQKAASNLAEKISAHLAETLTDSLQ